MSVPYDSIPSSRSVVERVLIRSFEYRRPHLFVRVRVASGIFDVVVGVGLLASMHWLGPLASLGVLSLAGAALLFWTARRVQAGARS